MPPPPPLPPIGLYAASQTPYGAVGTILGVTIVLIILILYLILSQILKKLSEAGYIDKEVK